MAFTHGWAGASAERHGARGGGAAWAKGAEGERIVGRMLDSLAGVRVLHDRAVPGSRANIDHVAIAPSGVYVIDAKHYAAEPRLDRLGDGSVLRLKVGPSDRTELVVGIRQQLGVVAEALARPDVPVRAVLCFAGAHWPESNGFVIDGVGVTSPERLGELLAMPGPLPPTEIESLHVQLRARLAAAWDA
ncbi:MAG TPA: nuclease-related domain-containing protein [Microbacteriaceae bacterium]|nr:nuclease-related domain-containing protein [Microbacteriaceae bacterium]